MGLFDKKYCSICGEKIGLLGNRKLDDGNLCKDCASKLSPWFSERRHSTIEQIREQLAYRAANREKVENFHVTRTFGSRTKVLIDDTRREFMVTSAKNWKDENPDVIPIRDVTGCNIKVDEDRDEVKYKNDAGEMVSYNPRRYKYGYNISVEIYVNSPYFSEIVFRLNDWQINIGEPGLSLLGVQHRPEPEFHPEYRRCMENAEEIRSALVGAREEIREEAASKQPVVCRACGATTKPDASGCCEYCGTPLS